ncbi:MAG: GNAT family N-acetyltransferase [Chloroflexi bacterium]|uniref:GNAT family N-acetyltransferase n=1 Tax=Candidatus Chlorohelix allophototropha TaxID=3003348 RepID=A0A8T7M6Z8_9CHLR|nr:GNAT family N-acetyltransferase [Chloroflexota bacterium]WJW69698.1 GNAT family N-acetyltransferase [Chloroflexota bacterium L227-S17]
MTKTGKAHDGFKVRHTSASEASLVAFLDSVLRKTMALTESDWKNYLEEIQKRGGVAFIIEVQGKAVGYAVTPPVPGLPNYNSLTGGILPEYQRKGFATALLKETLRELQAKTGEARRVVARIELNDTAIKSFLIKSGFSLQHCDIHMELDNLDRIPAVEVPPGFRLKTFKRDSDEAAFIEYHRLAFQDQPRFQPYSLEDVTAAQGPDFQDDDVILLENEDGSPAGFIWTTMHGDIVQIEPLGVSAQWRGKGLGKLLLNMGLRHGRARGATGAELWTGEDNQISINLYKKFGFTIAGGFAIYYIDIGS